LLNNVGLHYLNITIKKHNNKQELGQVVTVEV